MRLSVVFLSGALTVATAQAQTDQSLAELRSLLQTGRAAPPQQAASAPEAISWQLSPQEHAELRRQLADFSARQPAAKERAETGTAELHVENQERPAP